MSSFTSVADVRVHALVAELAPHSPWVSSRQTGGRAEQTIVNRLPGFSRRISWECAGGLNIESELLPLHPVRRG